MEQMRRLLIERGACEVPQFPEPLSQVWYHPDILLAARGEASANFFCFQSLWRRGSGAAAADSSCMPALIWLMNCSEKNFTTAAVDFISDLYFALTNSREESGFSLVADNSGHAYCNDRGCCWNLQYNGVGCGQISLFSELFSQPLTRPAVMLVLELAKLPGLLNQKASGLPAMWAERAAVSDLLALQAWQLKSLYGTREVLQHRQIDLGLELCRLISLLNSESMAASRDDAQLKMLSTSIGDAVQQLLSERSAGRVANRDVRK